MLKTLLVPVTGHATDRPALDTALAVARDFDAHVDALFVRPLPADAVPLLGEGMSGAMIDDIVRAAESETAALRDAARKMFDEAVADAGVAVRHDPAPAGEPLPTAAFRMMNGRPEDVLVVESRFADLVVFPHPAEDPADRQSTTIETVMISSGRPVMLAPAERPREIGRHVAIAWNGKAEAARAVTGAMPFIASADTVHVLTADTKTTSGTAGRRLAEYLAWHGIETEPRVVTPEGVVVGQALMDAAVAASCDLLVLGGYGHSRMREMIMGGVTRHMLGHPGIPVLMAH